MAGHHLPTVCHIYLILSLLQCNDIGPVKVRNTVMKRGQREMVYNPALNLFLLVERKKKKKDNPHSYPTFFNKKHSSLSSDTEQVPAQHKYQLSISEEGTGIPLTKSCQMCVLVN